jgi:hypothetical protein
MFDVSCRAWNRSLLQISPNAELNATGGILSHLKLFQSDNKFLKNLFDKLKNDK